MKMWIIPLLDFGDEEIGPVRRIDDVSIEERLGMVATMLTS